MQSPARKGGIKSQSRALPTVLASADQTRLSLNPGVNAWLYFSLLTDLAVLLHAREAQETAEARHASELLETVLLGTLLS